MAHWARYATTLWHPSTLLQTVITTLFVQIPISNIDTSIVITYKILLN